MNPAAAFWAVSIATLLLKYVGQERAMGHRPLIDFLSGKTNEPNPNEIANPTSPGNQLLAGAIGLVSYALGVPIATGTGQPGKA